MMTKTSPPSPVEPWPVRLDPVARNRDLHDIARQGVLPAETDEPRDKTKDTREGDAPLKAELSAAASPEQAQTQDRASGTTPPLTAPARTAAWEALRPLTLNPRLLERNLVITAGRTDPAHGAFDVLRTRMVQALSERGWRRVGITSPTKGCGKSFTAVNLAVTLSRYDALRTVLLDLDLRLPSLARTLGVADAPAMGDLLRGLTTPADTLRRIAPNPLQIGASLAIGLNNRREAYAAELFHDPRTARALARLEEELAPDVILIDMPPILAQDDVIALKAHVDCLLMVVGGGQTTPREMREAARRLGEDTPILGIVLNRAEGEGTHDYAY